MNLAEPPLEYARQLSITPPEALTRLLGNPRNFGVNMFPFGQERYRQLIQGLLAGIATRVKSERESLTFEENEIAPQIQPQIDAVNSQLLRELAAAEQKVNAARRAAEEQYQSEVRQVEAELTSAGNLAQRQYQTGLDAAEKNYKDEAWVISSVLDETSESNPKYKLDRLKAQLQQSRDWMRKQKEELDPLYDSTVELIGRRHHRLPEPDPSSFQAASSGEAFQGFPPLAERLKQQASRIRRLFVPKLFYGWNGLLVFILLWGGSYGLARTFLPAQQFGFTPAMAMEWELSVAGASLVLSGLIVLILYQIAAWRMSGPVEQFVDAMADVRRCQEVWLTNAKQELQLAEREYKTQYLPMVANRKQALQQLEVDRETQKQQILTTYETEKANLAKRRQATLQRAQEEHEYNLRQIDAVFEQEKQKINQNAEQRRQQLLQADAAARGEITTRRTQLKDKLVSGWVNALSKFSGTLTEIAEDNEGRPTPWEDILQSEWIPPKRRPNGLRLGEYQLDLTAVPDAFAADPTLHPQQSEYRLPAMLPFPTGSTLMLSAEGTGCTAGTNLLKVTMLRYLTQFPPGQVRFTVIDPSGLGEAFAPFMQLTDYDELLMTHRIWTDPSHIEEQLSKLTEHMENVFQKYLKDEFLTIEEFNEAAGEVAEPYRVLVINNYPAGFSERATQRLKSIIQSGPRCGVHTIISIDRRQPIVAGGIDLSRLGLDVVHLEWDKTTFMTKSAGPIPLPLIADELPPLKLLSDLISKAGELSKHTRRVEVPYHRIAPKPELIWTFDSRRSLESPLGRSGATNLQFLRLGKGTSQHVLMAGKTGSGKSTLLHIIVTTLALRYSPSEVEFYLIDFKKGVEFKTYASNHLPHARVIAIESDREFGVSVLERLDAILKERGELFRDAGVQDIGSFRDARPDVHMPRVLFLVDEFQEFFVEDDRYSQAASLLLDRLVRQGRAFGMHVILGSQTLGGSYSLPRTTIGQMAVRIALQCSENDAHLILSEDNTAARLLTRPGEAIYNDANGMIEGNNLFQVAWLGDAERDTYLEKIETMVPALKHQLTAPIIFEGNVPAKPEQNQALRDFVQTGAATPAADVPAGNSARFWIGEAVSITGPTMLEFRRWSGSNLLIVGQDQRGAQGIMQNTFVALAAGAGRPASGLPRFHLFVDPHSASGREWASLFEVQPWPVRISSPDEVAPRISELRDEIKRREADGAPAPPIFVIIDDLSRFRSLRKSGDDFSFGDFGGGKGKASTDKDFAEILRDGPPVGVHCIIWCDTSNNIDRWFSRGTMREFDMRIVFQMSGNDSSQLIDSPEAGRIGPNRAIIYSDEKGAREKFRPYGVVNEDWRNWLAQQWDSVPRIPLEIPAPAPIATEPPPPDFGSFSNFSFSPPKRDNENGDNGSPPLHQQGTDDLSPPQPGLSG